MRVDPAIAALRRDHSLQLRAQAAMFATRDLWREETRVAPVLADLAAFAAGAPLIACPALAELFGNGDAAKRFAAGLCATFAGALSQESFGQLPFRHGFDGVLSTLLLARCKNARLTLVAREPGVYQCSGITFSDAVRYDAVIAGDAAGFIAGRAHDGSIPREPVRLDQGCRMAFDLSRQGLFVERVERRLVTLRLHRIAGSPGPTREHSLDDGRLIRQSAGDIRESRQEMMLALLGRMKRGEAAPLMVEVAEQEGPDTLRWQALREALALDTASGFSALCRIARAPLDPLTAPAGALRAQLAEAHPELLAFEAEHCRA